MWQIWLYSLVSVSVVSLISLIGIFTISLRKSTLDKIIFIMVSLAVGALFGDAFLHLIPQSFSYLGTVPAALLVMGGLLFFFMLEKFLRWRHNHTRTSIHPVGYMNITADAVHNLIDGMLIGAAFIVSPEVGISTTIAVVLHEIPQEIGDFGILLTAGFSVTKALFLNFFCALFAFLGVAGALLMAQYVGDFAPVAVALTAGGFIYIAGSDLVPELQKESGPGKSVIQFAGIACGIISMLLLIFIEQVAFVLMNLLFIPVGFGVGLFGTLTGAGGAFILIPVLLYLFPDQPSDVITAISLAVVFANTASGSIAYARLKRADYRSGVLFAIATVPGAFLGVYTTGLMDRSTFDLVFGIFLAVIALFLLLKKKSPDYPPDCVGKNICRIVDSDGRVYEFVPHRILGMVISLGVGFIASMLGIGGGVIHVPSLVYLMRYPVHVATATSHFVLAVMSGIATLIHLYNGSLIKGGTLTLFIVAGTIIGAQTGALISHRVKGLSIVRALAVAMIIVGVRLIIVAVK